MTKKRAWLICLMLTLSGFILTGTLQSRSQADQQQEPQDKKVKQAEEVDASKFPIVDFTAVKSVDPKERAKRSAKSKKYDSKYAPPITEFTTNIYSITDFELALPALPVDRSSVVIVGEIADAKAYLSEDKSAIYSEFEVRIEAVLKNVSRVPLSSNSMVSVERKGGRVRFPSGKIVVSLVNNQDLPRVGRRYVLFLINNFPMVGEIEQDFHILTGYELSGGSVFPLDKIMGHSMTRYKGMAEESFLRDLSLAVCNASLKTHQE